MGDWPSLARIMGVLVPGQRRYCDIDKKLRGLDLFRCARYKHASEILKDMNR